MQDPLLGPLVHGMGLGVLFPVIFLLFIVWAFAWKAIALWHAAHNGQRIWFVALLVVNTVGILEIIYLKWFQEKVPADGTPEKMFPFLDGVRENITSRVSSRNTPGGSAS